MKRPDFNENITLQEFQDNYWYKSELQDLCKKYHLSNTGGKLDLKARLEQLISNNFDTQKVSNSSSISTIKKSSQPQKLPTSLDEMIPANFTCSELYREFFKEQIGNHFHFTAYMMTFLKKNPHITFKEYINEWSAEYERRKNKAYKPPIMESTQYNQYMRDFFADNEGKTLHDAIICWNYRKSKPGVKKYSKDDLVSLQKNLG